MTVLKWDQAGEHRYETGVSRGVLYIPSNGAYDDGVAWNGLTKVTESPSGAEGNAQYADNIKYLNLISAEDFGCTIEAFTYPDEFAQFDGLASPIKGVRFGQQGRKPFGLSYQTLLGNDTEGTDYGYSVHLVYGVQAKPSEKGYETVNDSPSALNFSWECTTTPVDAGEGYKPLALITINSTEFTDAQMKALTDALYGTASSDPRLPLPEEVVSLLGGTANAGAGS